MPAAHDIYAEQLSERHRGYPLYYPEPAPDDGPMEIGDVGFIRQGAFYRLFNVTRSADDPAQRFGVPGGFERLSLGRIRTYDTALEPGPLHSKTVSTVEANIGVPGAILPFDATFNFKCTSKRGAILMQETQMKREEAFQSQLSEDYLRRHCDSWHDFAWSNHIPLGFGQIMLVTECSKTAAWSSAVYSDSIQEFSISFSLGNSFVPCAPGLSTSAGVHRTGSIERRRSTQRATPDDPLPPKNHTVFFKAIHLGTRRSYAKSWVSFFMQSRKKKYSSFAANSSSASSSNVDTESTDLGLNSPSLAVSSKSAAGMTALPDLPDFHPATPLLALLMESNDNSNCVFIHDDEWCSPSPIIRQDVSQIIAEFTQFHFEHSEDLMGSRFAFESQQSSEFLDDVYTFPNIQKTPLLIQKTPLFIQKTPLLILKLSSASFLDTTVIDDVTHQLLYTINTVGPTTTITRADPWDGETKTAEIRWSRTISQKGNNVSDGVFIQVRDISWNGSETFLGRGGKFNIPNYAQSLKWKQQGNTYWCTTAAVKGPIAILNLALDFPQIQIFETLHNKNDSPLLAHHGVSTLLLDHLLTTALFLVTDLHQWAQLQTVVDGMTNPTTDVTDSPGWPSSPSFSVPSSSVTLSMLAALKPPTPPKPPRPSISPSVPSHIHRWPYTVHRRRPLSTPRTSSLQGSVPITPLRPQRAVSEDGKFMINKEVNKDLEDWVGDAEPGAPYDMPPPTYDSIHFGMGRKNGPRQDNGEENN